MKIFPFISLLMLFAVIRTNAQADPSAMVINKIPDEGFLFYEGWKFHPGDNPSWANPDFNDGKWRTVEPHMNPSELPQIRQAGIGWLRFLFKAGCGLSSKSLLLVLDLGVAAEGFYAARLPPPAGGGFLDPAYKHEPTIWVSTKRINTPSGDGGVLISVRDNGPGIPQKILDKIFQPPSDRVIPIRTGRGGRASLPPNPRGRERVWVYL